MITRQERAAKQLRELFAPGKDERQRRWLLSIMLHRTFVPGTQAGIRIGKPASTLQDAFSAFSRDEREMVSAQLAPIILELLLDYWQNNDEDGSYAHSLFVAAQIVAYYRPEFFGALKNSLGIMAAHSNFDSLPLTAGLKYYWKSL